MHVSRVIHALWAIFVVYWTVCAFGNKRTKLRQSAGSRLAYLVWAVATVYLVSSIKSLNVRLLPLNETMQSTGVLLCAGGVALAIWARYILGKNWSGYVAIKEGHELIDRGPYRFVRHPIYTGIILAAIGTTLALSPTARSFLIDLLLTVVFYIKARYEERALAREFGGQYAGYKERVKAALIPFVL